MPSPAEGTPLVIVGGATALAGGIWTTAIVASAEGDDYSPLAASVPVLGLGLVLVGIGFAKWAGPSPYDDSVAARPLTVTGRGLATSF